MQNALAKTCGRFAKNDVTSDKKFRDRSLWVRCNYLEIFRLLLRSQVLVLGVDKVFMFRAQERVGALRLRVGITISELKSSRRFGF